MDLDKLNKWLTLVANFAILGGLLVSFVWGFWCYDLVAFAGLLAAVALGVVPVEEAFLGFGHPAVITVAAVLIVALALVVFVPVVVLCAVALALCLAIGIPLLLLGLAVSAFGALFAAIF